jgi:hypothetical protein
MRKIFRILFFTGLLVFIVIQFFQPDRNASDDISNHILEIEKVPDNIKMVLENSCLDCHSNQTNYLWYHKMAPVSWMIDKHIQEGKDELNFSEWGAFNIYDKIETLEEMYQEVERKKMPLKSYTSIHKKAKLSEKQEAELRAWTEKLGLELLAKIEK